MNPKGILIGKDAQINVESFFASTLDLKNIDDFESEMFFQDSSNSSIVHLGNINAKADIYLISKAIKNSGQIVSEKGSANLIAATKVLIKPNLM